jgi:SAM-dependent methyltransferase
LGCTANGDDSLPGDDAVLRLGAAFDIILLSAVWMHVAPADRPRAFRNLVTLLKPDGMLVPSLRIPGSECRQDLGSPQGAVSAVGV